MDVRGKDSGKGKHSQVCMRSPMEGMWTDAGGLGQSANDTSMQPGVWGLGGQGDAGPHQLPSGASKQVDQDCGLVGSRNGGASP